MAASTALRALLGASLGLGAIDVAWIDLALAPRAIATPEPARPTPVAAPSITVTPVAPVPEAPPPMPAIDEHVYFATLSSTLEPSARTTLARLVHDAAPSAVFVLEGHADYRGSEPLNRTLSKDRAEVVASYLASLGVAQERIRVGFVGKAGATPQNELWRDRRVDLHVGAQP